jgi:predicted ABC-type sugar transport system permease subunit
MARFLLNTIKIKNDPASLGDGNMTTSGNTSQNPAMVNEGAIARFLRATEIDTRVLGMIAALFLIWCAFDIYSGILRPNTGLFNGSFLTPRNLWTLLVQTSSIAVMTTGMVLIIVMRHIDLSVGSMLSLIAVASGVLQVYQLGPALGVGHPSIWILAILAALALGTLIGAFNGYLTAYAQIPAFIVTLGGLIAYSGVAFLMARTILELDACLVGLRCNCFCNYQWPQPTRSLQVSTAARMGGSHTGSDWQFHRTRDDVDREFLSLATKGD